MKTIHLANKYRTLTPCGLIASHSPILMTDKKKKVTCKKCKKTNWFKTL